MNREAIASDPDPGVVSRISLLTARAVLATGRPFFIMKTMKLFEWLVVGLLAVIAGALIVVAAKVSAIPTQGDLVDAQGDQERVRQVLRGVIISDRR